MDTPIVQDGSQDMVQDAGMDAGMFSKLAGELTCVLNMAQMCAKRHGRKLRRRYNNLVRHCIAGERLAALLCEGPPDLLDTLDMDSYIHELQSLRATARALAPDMQAQAEAKSVRQRHIRRHELKHP